MSAGRGGRLVDWLLALGVFYWLGLLVPFVAFSGQKERLPLVLAAHLGPLVLARDMWLLPLLWPAVVPPCVVALFFPWARARGLLPVFAGLFVAVWLAIGTLFAPLARA